MPALDELAERLGLDLTRPVCCVGDGRCYLFHGIARSQSGYELDFYGANHCISMVVHPCPDGYQDEQINVAGLCVLLEIFG